MPRPTYALAALLVLVLAPLFCDSHLRAQAAALSDSAGVAAVERIPPGSRLVVIRRAEYTPENAIIRSAA